LTAAVAQQTGDSPKVLMLNCLKVVSKSSYWLLTATKRKH